MFLDPLGQFTFLVISSKSFVSKDHYSVIGFSSKRSSHTLSGMTHCVKCQKVIFADLELIPHIF